MKIRNLIRLHKLPLSIAIGLMLTAGAFGQTSGRSDQGQKDHNAELRQYTWKARIEIRKGGETKVVRLEEVRHDPDGTRQNTQLSVTAPELPTGGLRGMIAKKKKEQFTELVSELTALARSYGELPTDQKQRFMENASISPEAIQQSLIRFSGSNILRPGDSMSIWVDPIARRQRKVEVRTIFNGKAVRIVSEFRDLAGGPTYMATAVIEYPDEALVIRTENFDHVRREASVIEAR